VVAVLGGPETGGLSIVLGFVASELLDKAFEVASEWAVDEVSRKFATGPDPEILEGSPNVFFNKLEAARGGPDGDNTLSRQQIMQGSKWVYTNLRPAARQDDRTRASGFCVLKPGLPQNIYIGGPPTDYDNKPQLGPEAQLLLTLTENFSTLKDLPKKISNLSMQAKQLRNAANMGGKVGTRATKLGKDAYEVGNGVWGIFK
jgi:uncharacterized Zn-binding protein involved in type VI secretion